MKQFAVSLEKFRRFFLILQRFISCAIPKQYLSMKEEITMYFFLYVLFAIDKCTRIFKSRYRCKENDIPQLYMPVMIILKEKYFGHFKIYPLNFSLEELIVTWSKNLVFSQEYRKTTGKN